MDEEWKIVGEDKKVRPSKEHKDFEKQFGVRGLANTLASSEVANLEQQGFKFYTVEKAPKSPPVDHSDDFADYAYVLIQDNRWGDYAGFMRWKDAPRKMVGFKQVHTEEVLCEEPSVSRFACLLDELDE